MDSKVSCRKGNYVNSNILEIVHGSLRIGFQKIDLGYQGYNH